MLKDYNMNQLVLPLDLEINLQQNDIAFNIFRYKYIKKLFYEKIHRIVFN